MRLTHILVPLLVAGLVGVPAGAAVAGDGSGPATPLSIMTRNLDLGSDLGPVLAATTPAGFLHGVSTVYDEIAASDIPDRAEGIAAEIGRSTPMVVSMQEVSLVQRLVPTSTGWTLVDQIDQLGALQAALARRGLDYTVAVDTHEFDVTVPSDTGPYVRLLDRDVILTRADLPPQVFSVANPRSGHFSHLLSLPTPVGPAVGTRGWASVDVTRLGTTVRVVDTHLESLSGALAQAQAAELLAGPADTPLPVVVAGDLNSGPGTTTGAYDVLAGALTDTWPATRPDNPGLTWALFGEDGLPLQASPSRRIDVILTRDLTAVTDVLVGIDDRTPSGRYPSDHAGVVARLAPR